MNDLKFDEALYQEALSAYNNAYTPYSNFNVGAVLLMKDGTTISGANVENSSFGLTSCAERNTLFSAYSAGYRKDDIEMMLVVGPTSRPISPCGACRQVMSELMTPTTKIMLTNLDKEKMIIENKDLLPYRFSDEDLNDK